VQGAKPPCRGLGCPQRLPFFLAACGEHEGEVSEDTPHPAKGLAAPGSPQKRTFKSPWAMIGTKLEIGKRRDRQVRRTKEASI